MVHPLPHADPRRRSADPVWPDFVRKIDCPNPTPAPAPVLQRPFAEATNETGVGAGALDLPYTPQKKRHQQAAFLMQKHQQHQQLQGKEQDGEREPHAVPALEPEPVQSYAFFRSEYVDLNSSLRLTMDGRHSYFTI